MRWLYIIPLLLLALVGGSCTPTASAGYYGDGDGGGGSGATQTFGAYSARPAAGTAGAAYRSTDGPYVSLDNGSAWTDFIGGVGKVVVPPSAGWTTLSGTPNQTTSGGMQRLQPTGTSLTTVYRSAPAAPYTVTIGWMSTMYGDSIASSGSFRAQFYNIAGDNSAGLMIDNADLHRQYAVSFTALSTGGGGAFPATGATGTRDATRMGGFFWAQLEDDGVNLTLKAGVGPTGPWTTVYTVGRTAGVFSGGAPDAIAISVTNSYADIVHYEEM